MIRRSAHNLAKVRVLNSRKCCISSQAADEKHSESSLDAPLQARVSNDECHLPQPGADGANILQFYYDKTPSSPDVINKLLNLLPESDLGRQHARTILTSFGESKWDGEMLQHAINSWCPTSKNKSYEFLKLQTIEEDIFSTNMPNDQHGHVKHILDIENRKANEDIALSNIGTSYLEKAISYGAQIPGETFEALIINNISIGNIERLYFSELSAQKIFDIMVNHGQKPTENIYAAFISGHGLNMDAYSAQNWFERSQRDLTKPRFHLQFAFINALALAGEEYF